jgi:urease beta subunit
MSEGNITLTVTREEVALVLDCLMDRPFRQVAPLVHRLMDEANRQAGYERLNATVPPLDRESGAAVFAD